MTPDNSISGRLLHLRALNHLVRDHPFTYVGSRVLSESFDDRLIDRWTLNYISRKAGSDRRQVYWKHSLFKGLDSSGKAEYRTCLVGSPTTQLAETWLLWRLSQEEAFRPHPAVYSYRWSKPGSGHTFRFFLKGYKQREIDIATALRQSDDTRVLVADLRKFYPSIDRNRTMERFKQRLKKSDLAAREQEAAVKCVEDLFSVPRVEGLPIGPSLSHLLANVFFAEIDEKLAKRFPNRYFRYVDDIGLVVSRSELREARRYLGEIASSEGLSVHPDKDDDVPASSWIESVEERHGGRVDSFGKLIHDLRVYLAYRPDSYDDVQDLFRENSIYLPFSKLRSTASYSRFRKFLWKLMARIRRLPRPSQMLTRATNLRREFLLRLQQHASKQLPSNGMSRRWAVQQYRFTVNRLLYLLPEKERAELLQLIPACEELTTTSAILSALIKGDASEILKFAGPSIQAFCQLWLESRQDKPKIDWSNEPDMHERDSAVVMALYGLASPPDEWIGKLPLDTSRLMVRLASGRRPSRRTYDDFSYIDEMESLWLTPQFDAVHYLSTRFDDGEAVFLPALDLGGDFYMT